MSSSWKQPIDDWGALIGQVTEVVSTVSGLADQSSSLAVRAGIGDVDDRDGRTAREARTHST